MIPWQLVDRAAVPGTGEKICLYRRGDEFVALGAVDVGGHRLP